MLPGTTNPQTFATIEAVARVLRPGEALIDTIQTGPSQLLCFLIVHGHDDLVATWSIPPQESLASPRIPGALRRWNDHRREWLRALREDHALAAGHGRYGPEVTADWRFDAWEGERATLADLGELILGDVLPTLRARAVTRLIVSPDGLLHRVPWAALRIPRVDGASAFLIDEFELQLVPSAARLVDLRGRPAVKAARLVATAPFWEAGGAESATSREFILRDHVAEGERPHPLPASRNEIDAIAKLFQDRLCATEAEALPLHRGDATVDAVLGLLPKTQFLHLATHGQAVNDVEVLRRFRILFAGGGTYPVSAMYSPPPSYPDLVAVVLSACHLGNAIARGAEAVGFAEAFLQAGARLVLAPLWAVLDGPTASLMIEWYRELLAGDRPEVATAWRRAVLALRKDLLLEHPFYWAGFLPTGDGSLRVRPQDSIA